MPSPEDRQAKALEQIRLDTRGISKALEALNDNFVIAFKFLKHKIEEDEARYADNPNQMTLDDLRAQEEKAVREREQQAAFEESVREFDPFKTKDETKFSEGPE